MISKQYTMKKRAKNIGLLSIILIAFFVVFYPLLASVHNFLPMFFGVCAYMMVLAIKKENILLLTLTIIYSISLEINFSLPLFNTIIAVLLFYIIFYNKIRQTMTCKPCIATLSVILLYNIYFAVLFLDDKIFSTSNHLMHINWFFLFNLAIDIFLVVII